MKPRIIVCGLGRTGYRIFSLLKQQGADVIGISDRPLTHNPKDEIVVGVLNSATTLLQAGIRSTQTLVLASHDDALNLAILTQARLLNPHIRIINRLYNQTLGERLDHLLSNHITLSVSALSAPIFAFSAMGNKAIGQLRLFQEIWSIQEEIIDEFHPWYQKTFNELWENPEKMFIYYLPAQGELDLVSAVIQGQKLQKGDHIIIGNRPKIKKNRWNLWKQLIKLITNLKQYKSYIKPVLIITLILFLTILFATLTYLSVNLDTPFIDAFYFSVGMITGAGGQEEVAESAPNWIKLFTAFMMIIGAGIVGIFYALINDFVLGSRIKQAWDVARIPPKNHYIICGLGGIGMQIVKQLHHQGHEIVILECDPNNRFLNTVRSMGIPVIIEDARLENTLKIAKVETASSLLAVTHEDMINVEIALTAKAINPKLAVIVRTYDSKTARSIQDVFEFESVFSPSELATHSFTAAALGGRILGNGMTDDLLWVALATLITPNHPFCQQKVKFSAMSANFVPLYLERKKQTIHGWNLLETELQSGDILYLTIPATGLDQLWRSQDNPVISSFNPAGRIHS